MLLYTNLSSLLYISSKLLPLSLHTCYFKCFLVGLLHVWTLCISGEKCVGRSLTEGPWHKIQCRWSVNQPFREGELCSYHLVKPCLSRHKPAVFHLLLFFDLKKTTTLYMGKPAHCSTALLIVGSRIQPASLHLFPDQPSLLPRCQKLDFPFNGIRVGVRSKGYTPLYNAHHISN